ncbi:MAG: NADPH:quinone oxidoreductase family protein, partial [Alphaproteobacteria bacterium]
MITYPAARHWVTSEPGADGLVLEPYSPSQPVAGELLIEVHAAALNFSDILMIDDRYQVKPPRPFTPGQEVAGVVVAAGPGTNQKIGARIAGKVDWGGFSTHAIVRDDMATPVPAQMPLADAAALPVTYTTAYVALTESTALKASETVLVHAAAGGIGLAAVQIAVALGATVIGTAGSEEKRAIVREHGAAHCLDYGTDDWAERCRDLTQGRGVDVVVDPVGGDTTIQSLGVMAYCGRLLIVGFASGAVANIPAHRLLLQRLSAIGVYWNQDLDGQMLARVAKRMRADITAGTIRPVVDIRDGLEQLRQALDDLANR